MTLSEVIEAMRRGDAHLIPDEDLIAAYWAFTDECVRRGIPRPGWDLQRP